MKKFTILVIFSHLLLAFMALGLTLASCEAPSNNRSNDETIEMVTVRFNANGGSGPAPAARTVEAGSRITLPDGDGLTRSGYTFGGWNTKRDGTGINYSAGSSYTVTGDTTLYAKWNVVSAGSFTVTFYSNGGSSVEVQIVSSGDTATRPTDPAKSGYTFDNWYRDESLTTVYNFGAPVTGNITLYAKWAPVVTYTVTFDSNGATSGTPPSAQTVNAGSVIILPSGSGLSKDGYAFGGWNTRADDWGINHSADSSYTVQNDITLYAHWIIVPVGSFTVTFDSNGGSSVDMEIVQSGDTTTRPVDPTKIGHTFEGWYSDENLTTVYNFSTPVTDNIILYARWDINQYTVTFNANGGTSAPVPQTIDHGDMVNEPAVMTKANYTFGGWFKEAALINQWNFATDTVTGTITLYAKWTLNQYTVTFNSNGGSNVTTQTVNSGGTATRPADPTRNNYTFDNWYSDESLTTVYNFSTLVTKNIPLYAKWNINQYTVTFNSNGGSSVTTQTVNSGGTATRPTNPTRSNYTFDNWYSDSGLTTVYNFSTPVTENIILYANWIATYTVTFNSNGGSGTTSSAQTVAANITLPSGSGLTKDGYTFGGWNTNSSGTGTNYSAGSSYTVTSTVTLYARWIEMVISASGVELVRIPGGSFQMGTTSNDYGNQQPTHAAWPVHTVTLSGFYMGKYEVTQAQYEAVMGTNPSYFKTANSRPPVIGETDGNRPVEYVRWYDAVEFCNALSEREGLTPYYTINKTTSDPNNTSLLDTYKWLVTRNTSATGYRLPTEAQWEYACRAGTTTKYNTGDTINYNTGWYTSNSGSKTHEVGLKPANAWGLHDMHGNVGEWCWDWRGDYSSGAQTDPTGASSGAARVLRGGDWDSSAVYLFSAHRENGYPSGRNQCAGFRVVRP